MVLSHDPLTSPLSRSAAALTPQSPELLPSLAPCDSLSASRTTLSSSPSSSSPVSSPINAHLSSTQLPPLPSPTPLANPSFGGGGSLDANSFIQFISSAYSEVVHWDTFIVPYGNAGKKFVNELSTLYRAYAEGTALECVAMKAITVMSVLLLQQIKTKRSLLLSGTTASFLVRR